MTYQAKITIRIEQFSETEFHVRKSGKDWPFHTYDEAKAHALALQERAGGPDKADIKEIRR